MKCNILKFEVLKEEITAENVLEMSEVIAFAQTRFLIGYNKKQRTQINNAIRNFFALRPEIKPTENHLLLSQLPIKSYWTTNYDRLLEKTFDIRNISYRAQFSDESLSLSTNNAQVIIHKMHGDVENPVSAVIAKEDYEKYDDTHEMMLAKFKGEMCSKTFLFLGYSFSDPNIHHILARIRKVFDKNAKQHYCIMKRVSQKEFGKKTKDYEYKLIKQEHQILDFRNYGVNVILVEDYNEIKDILSEIRRRVFMKNVLICGAYEEETMNKNNIANFTITLSTWLIERGFHIFSGFGKNLGGYVVKGAFDGCTLGNGKIFNNYVKLFPFPYNVDISNEERTAIYTGLRKNMIANTQITIIICGEKKDSEGKIIPSPGVIEEAELSRKQGNLIIPIAVTGGAAYIIWKDMTKIKNKGYKLQEFNALNQTWKKYEEILYTVENILSHYIS